MPCTVLMPSWCVESGYEFAVGGAGGGQVVIAFVELLLYVEVVLFELADALVEGVDVDGGAEPGFAPGLFTEGFGQPLLQLLNAGIEPGGAFVGGEQVGLQRGAGDPGPVCSSVTGSACSAWIFSSRSGWR